MKESKPVNAAIVMKGIEKDAKKHFKLLEVSAIKSNDQLQVVVSNLKALKELSKIAKEKYDALVNPSKEAAKKTKEAADDLFDPFFDSVVEREMAIKSLIKSYSEKQQDKIKSLTIGKGGVKAFMQKQSDMEATADGMQNKNRWVAVVTNKKKLPLQFMEPDMKAIVAACKAGKVPPGVTYKQEKVIAI